MYAKEEADRIAKDKSWVFKQDGDKWRRVVASPEPKRIFELRPIKWLLEHNTIVIAAGGGGHSRPRTSPAPTASWPVSSA